MSLTVNAVEEDENFEQLEDPVEVDEETEEPRIEETLEDFEPDVPEMDEEA